MISKPRTVSGVVPFIELAAISVLDSSALEWGDAGESVCLSRLARRECGCCAIGNRFALVPIETDSRIPAWYTFFTGRHSYQFEEKIGY